HRLGGLIRPHVVRRGGGGLRRILSRAGAQGQQQGQQRQQALHSLSSFSRKNWYTALAVFFGTASSSSAREAALIFFTLLKCFSSSALRFSPTPGILSSTEPFTRWFCCW